ncbi:MULTISPECIES: hypothetical protein [Pseudoalteromonas]|uniref:hypothetical protein n=1 Tax=Pseudoalteromonas TaxID=53246 RepID=UPI001581F29C|nr:MULTISPECIES: hypothetical protein [Pseudoalteromonas]MDI4652603.1 hypothetical protein [Pseudoalteromonas shioyasakiensis]NUJ38688.1 hypothetical protein [Pseudoalteromonas sp. 0303]
MFRSLFCVTLFTVSCSAIAQPDNVKGRVIKVYPLSSNVLPIKGETPAKDSKRDVYKIPSTRAIEGSAMPSSSEPETVNAGEVSTGVEIRKGTVNDNIIRIAKEELGIPASNVDFLYIPCDLVERYSYVIPESNFEDKYERLTYYASQYSFFSTFNPMTNTVTLEYRGPDVFENCRKSK